ncbi:hypothetical protein BHM03_00029380 [Ensete ventricosum]|uniref:Uncharacterized protein n=1 Tax=Ensete ventricosum TaxID=4639 RepID=A0A445MI04_ENSVE|nr:hypothetical protein BHM03_00029380 [Ensete ventricosum]
MILNYVESFYALFLYFRSKGNSERRWLATARPSARVAGHGQAPAAAASHGQPPCRAGHPQPGLLQGAAGCCQSPLQGGGRPWPKPLAGAAASMRGRPRVWLAPTGATLASVGITRGHASGGGRPLQGRKGQPRGQVCRLQGPARCRPRAAAPVAGAASYADGMQRHRLRRGSGAEGARRGLGHPFEKRTILPL